jgi:hypothetical protein
LRQERFRRSLRAERSCVASGGVGKGKPATLDTPIDFIAKHTSSMGRVVISGSANGDRCFE